MVIDSSIKLIDFTPLERLERAYLTKKNILEFHTAIIFYIKLCPCEVRFYVKFKDIVVEKLDNAILDSFTRYYIRSNIHFCQYNSCIDRINNNDHRIMTFCEART